MVQETTFAPGTCPPMPNPPTNWFWNIRVGDKIQINNSGPWYTVVGPMAISPAGTTINGTFYSNPEMFVNVGPPGILSPLIAQYNGPAGACQTRYQPDFLFLVNSQDDNDNGWIDEGWDGVDNNGNGFVDENAVINGQFVTEWEPEQLLGAARTACSRLRLRTRFIPSSVGRHRRPTPERSPCRRGSWST